MKKRTTRRQFLKRTAFAAVMPTIISSTALGQGKMPPPSERVNIGHIGVGNRGGGLLGGALKKKNAQIVGISDCFSSRRQAAIKKISDAYTQQGRVVDTTAKGYPDFREMLAREDIDAVVIATQDHWHVPLSIYALQAGKDVYVEKPLGVSVDHGFKLRKLVQDKNAILQYGTQQRSDYYFRFACELTRNGYIGELKTIDAWAAGMRAPGWYAETFKKFHPSTPAQTPPADLDYDRWVGPAPMTPYTDNRVTEWGTYHIYDYALGFIAGWGAHPLDIAQWGNSDDETAPVLYEGTGTIPTDGLFDTIAEWDMHCTYANGVKMHFMDTITAMPAVKKYHPDARDHGTTFHGSEGWVSVRRGALHCSDQKMRKIKLKETDTHLYQSNDHMANFIDCIRTRKQPISNVKAAVQSDLVSHLSNAAIRLKRPIKWDSKKEQIIGDNEAVKSINRTMRSPWTV
ncbi:MAG: Gfo/Idh/MocA family oxidoreductase [Phycisphaerae bacterium]|nr:Gfo/Idh/MocA family oxidoreductase [Phycisphaerae bacterium]